MDTARVLGNNIRFLLNSNGIDKESFASNLGYSLFDVEKLCDARLITTKEDINDIANFFSVTPTELLSQKDSKEYTGDGFMQCMKQFKDEKNKEKILNIFDMYCDIKESLNL